jgi:hypothetical protein
MRATVGIATAVPKGVVAHAPGQERVFCSRPLTLAMIAATPRTGVSYSSGATRTASAATSGAPSRGDRSGGR